MTVNVSASIENPTHHISLSDGSTTIGLMAVNPRGDDDIKQIKRAPYPRTSLKISQGDSQYGDNELPYITRTQESMAGGRGQDNFEDDQTRFYDSCRASTQFEGRVIPGSMDFFFTKGDSKVYNNWTGNVKLLSNSDVTYLARKFQAPATFNLGELHLLVKFTYAAGSGDLTVALYNDNAGAIGTLVGTIGTIYENSAYAKFNKLLQHYVLKPTSTLAMTSGNYYWIKITGNDFSRWDFGLDPNSGTTYINTVAGGFVLYADGDLTFMITEDVNITGGKFFDYRGAKYCYQNYSGGSRVLINGDRGAADTSASSTLVDATKSWTTNEWAGCVVQIMVGTGAKQKKTYRSIASNTSTTLTITGTWDNVPDSNSEYVILGSKKWTSLITFSYNISDVAVTDKFIYFAFGEEDTLERYEYYNASGTWSSRNAAESLYADKLLAVYSPGGKRFHLYGSQFFPYWAGFGYELNSTMIFKMSVPPVWGALYHEVGTLLEGGDAMQWRVHLESTGHVYYTTVPDRMYMKTPGDGGAPAVYPTGYLGYRNLEQVTDLLSGGGSGIAFAVHPGDYPLDSDVELLLSREINVGFGSPQIVFNDGANFIEFTAMTDRKDSGSGSPYEMDMDFDTSTDALYIGSPYPFNLVKVDLGTAVNAVAATLTVQYFGQGGGWNAVAGLSDGTASAGATLAVDGSISYTMPTNWTTGLQNYTGGAEANWATAGNDAPVDYYWIKITVSANLTNPTRIAELWVENPNGFTGIDFPSCSAAQFSWATFSFATYNDLHLRQCASIGLRSTAEQRIEATIAGGIKLVSWNANYISFHGGKVLNMVGYGDEITNPWIITEEGIFEIQTEADDAIVKLPLSELKQAINANAGKAMITNDVYLYFNLDRRLERYYNRTLEDVGPDKDEGLDSQRSGTITQLVSYPGSIMAVVCSDFYRASILERRGSGWHDVYWAPYNESNIHAASAQVVPGQVNRLWVMIGDSIAYLYTPISYSDDHQSYVYSSYVETSWISMGYLDVSKRFTTIKLYTENLNASGPYIYIDYQLESSSGSWTRLATTVTTSPYQDVSLGSSGLSGKRIRFRFVFISTTTMTTRPVLRAWVLEALLRIPVKHSYTIPVRVSDLHTSLSGPDDQKTRAETVQAQLDTWAGTPPTILTFRCLYSPFDNKSVILEPPPMQPTDIVVGTSPDAVEQHVAEIMLLEV